MFFRKIKIMKGGSYKSWYKVSKSDSVGVNKKAYLRLKTFDLVFYLVWNKATLPGYKAFALVILKEEKNILVISVSCSLESVVAVLVDSIRIGAKFEKLLHRTELAPVNWKILNES